jgi:type II secretory pathway pseudopilin PulG
VLLGDENQLSCLCPFPFAGQRCEDLDGGSLSQTGVDEQAGRAVGGIFGIILVVGVIAVALVIAFIVYRRVRKNRAANISKLYDSAFTQSNPVLGNDGQIAPLLQNKPRTTLADLAREGTAANMYSLYTDQDPSNFSATAVAKNPYFTGRRTMNRNNEDFGSSTNLLSNGNTDV